MSDRLSPEREAEIAASLAAYVNHPMIGFNCCSAHPVADAVPDLLAELAAVRKERDKAQRYAALLEADLCQCEPLCEGGEYQHAADCPVVEHQQAAGGAS